MGIDRRLPGRLRVRSLALLPGPAERFVKDAIATSTDSEFCWPAPECEAELQFTLMNPATGTPRFAAGAETPYWPAKRMTQGSYLRYAVQRQGRVPLSPEDNMLEYTINGRSRRSPAV